MFDDKKIEEKIKEIMKRIEAKNSDNIRLQKAMDNVLFQRAAAVIELLPYGLKYDDKKRKGTSIMAEMVRYDTQTKSKKIAVAWLRFPTSDKINARIVCELQKFGYTSDKVVQPSPTNIYGTPKIKIDAIEGIEEMAQCIQEYMSEVHHWRV